MLDLDSSTCEFPFWRHDRFFEALCLGPTHLPKAWKHQIAKLGLSAENSKSLLGRVWSFALKMELCDYAALDAEWEDVTKFALSLCNLQPNRDLELLPAELRLACQASLSGMHSSVPIETQDQHSQFKLYTDITDHLDFIAARVERQKSVSGVNHSQSMQSLQEELFQIASRLCSAGVQDDNLIKMMDIHNKIKNMKSKKNLKPKITQGGSSSSAATQELVVSAMQQIYSLARCFCQRVTCQGFTHHRRSSTWSEISNNSIKNFIKPSKLVSGEYTLSSFIMDADRWIHKQCERCYQANKITYKFKSEMLSEPHVNLLQQVLCNGAVSDLLKKLLPSTMKEEFTVHDSAVLDFAGVCPTFRNRVMKFMLKFNIELHEVRCFKATSVSSAFKPSTAGECITTDSAEEIDQVHENLLEACAMANKELAGHVLAVYFPDRDCKIDFFTKDRPFGHGIPLFCSCMRHTASGLPCQHMLSWILRKPRSVWTIVYKRPPSFITIEELH
jgi:hypothetical protein